MRLLCQTVHVCKILSPLGNYGAMGATETTSVVDTGVSGFVSCVATPTPRHKGHAFRPETNHYSLDWQGRRTDLIDTFFMEEMAATG